MASTGKAFTSIACGIMLHEFREKIPDGLETKVFTEKRLPDALAVDDPRKAEIKLGQLLCMTAGYFGRRAVAEWHRDAQGYAAETGAGTELPRPRSLLSPRAALDRA
jgi:CubicO group peptidase (beta-lactamase class C family)